jgi:hypothetical protein
MSFYKESGFSEQELNKFHELKNALDKACRNRKERSLDRTIMGDCSGYGLCAADFFARLIWGRAFCDVVEQHVGELTEIYFVTITDIRCSVPLTEINIDIGGFRQVLNKPLRGLSYVGMIEPAYYQAVSMLDIRKSRTKIISWHFHGIVWGINYERLKRIFRNANGAGWTVPLVSGLKGSKCKKITSGTLPKVIGYFLKAPANEYRIFEVECDRRNKPRFIQRKCKLRSGPRITLFDQMKGIPLTALTMSGGEGAAIVRGAKSVALNEIKRRLRRIA